jgi:hypothetical protein
MPTSSFDAETLDLMSRAFEAAWEEVGFALANKDADLTALRTMMAVKIMAAVAMASAIPTGSLSWR